MKKRVLSFILMLSMLVGCFTVFATGAAAEEGTALPKSSKKSAGSYLDLYVKDGLVAIFDAYSASASTSEETAWRPADLHGKAGYSSYVDSDDYTATLSRGTYLGWKWENGYLSHYVHTVASGARGDDADSFINMDTLGAHLGSGTYTVEEVYRLTPYTGENQSPKMEGGKVTNFDTLAFDVYGGKSHYGNLTITPQYFAKYPYHSGKFFLGGYRLDVAGSYYFFQSDYYGYVKTSLTDEAGASLADYHINAGAMGVIQTAISRTGASSYTLFFREGVVRQNDSGAGNAVDVTASGTSTQLQVQRGNAANIYSVRIYNKVLSEKERNQNHLADLLGFYGVSADVVLALDAEELAEIIDATASLTLAKGERGSESYAVGKKEVENVLARFAPPLDMGVDERKKSDYDKLYVGADGSQSTSGGSLVALYSAYAGATASANISGGVWYNKMAQTDAYFYGGEYSSFNTGGWRIREDGGVGYDLTISPSGSDLYMIPQGSNALLSLDKSLIASSDFTVEYSAAFHYHKLADGTDYTGTRRTQDALNGIPTDRIGYFGNYATRAGSFDATGGNAAEGTDIRGMNWYVGKPGESWHDVYARAGSWGSGQTLWRDVTRSTDALYVQSVARDESDDGSTARYAVSVNGTEHKAATWDSTTGEESFFYYPKSEENYVFELFNRTPVTVYAVRVYSATLTQAEMTRNRFIDIAAYHGVDISAYATLSTDLRAIVEDTMAKQGFDGTKEAFEKSYLALVESMSGEFSMDDTLYVTEGLTVLLASYLTLKTPTTVVSESSMLWQNAMGESSFVNLKGKGWTANAVGGLTIVKTLDDYHHPNASTSLYNTKEDYAIVLGSDMLPTGDYTVEYVANPVGITNEDGSRVVQSDNILMHDNSIAIGPLRAMQFPARESYNRWWRYSASANPHSTDGWPPNFWYEDTTWSSAEQGDIITTAITLDTSSGNHTYNIYNDAESVYVNTIAEKEVISVGKAQKLFRLMGGMAGTVYAVRVYDRVLTEEERAQNHFADLVYYYGIDISALKGAIDAMGGPSLIASAFTDVGFNLEREEAEALFEARLTSVWLSYTGFGVRKDLSDGMRFYFDIGEAGIRAMLMAGASVEIGALVNVGKNAQPVLDGYGYDYKIVAYNNVMGKENSLYIDEDSFAVTVRYAAANRETLLKNVLCRGYVKMTLADGMSLLYYTSESESAPADMFEAYSTLQREKHETLRTEFDFRDYVASRVEECYLDKYVYLNAAASEGGNGSEGAPFKYFEDTFAHAKSILGTLREPMHLYLSVANGFYSTGEVLSLSGDDAAYEYFDFTILSKDGDATLSTLSSVTGEFTSLGNNIYAYQFEKDENGEYPAFRYLYVNGERAGLASNAGRSAFSGAMLQTGFDRDFDGVHANAVAMAKEGGVSFDTVPEQYADRPDLLELFNIYLPYATAWTEVTAIYESLSSRGTSAQRDGKALADAVPTTSAKQSYQNAFIKYQTMYLARYEAECKARVLGFNGLAYYNATCSKSEAEDKLYYDTFHAAKYFIYWEAINNGNKDVAAYEIAVEQLAGYRGYDLKKFYLSETLLGGAIDMVRDGKDRTSAYADTLDPVKDAALIAEMKHEYRWMNHALRGCGVEVTLSLQYMENVFDINGIDLDDYYVDENGEKHYACYFENYERMRMPQGTSGYYSLADRYVVTSNAYCYLDSENEYYYDEKTGTLYYYSESGVNGKSFAYPSLDSLLKFENIRGIRIEGITFTGVDDYFMTENGHYGSQAASDHSNGNTYMGAFPDRAALYLENITDLTVKNCKFVELGCEGITARGWMEDIRVEGCTFKNVGAAAIRFGESYREHEQQIWIDGELGNKNITVVDNYLESISLDYLTPAIYMSTCKDVSVKYNTVKDTAYTGISLGWTWGDASVDRGCVTYLENVEVAYNFLSGFCNRGDDGGAIYVLGRPNSTITADDDTYINRMHHNYVLYDKNTGVCKEGVVAGLYLDGSSSNWHVSKNVIVAPAYGAAEGETDYDKYGITAEEAARLEANRDGMIMIFPQWVPGQLARNILMEDNYLIGMRSTDREEQYKEAFKGFMDKGKSGIDPEERGLIVENPVYVVGTSQIPSEAGRIIEGSGSKSAHGVISDITDFVY